MFILSDKWKWPLRGNFFECQFNTWIWMYKLWLTVGRKYTLLTLFTWIWNNANDLISSKFTINWKLVANARVVFHCTVPFRLCSGCRSDCLHCYVQMIWSDLCIQTCQPMHTVCSRNPLRGFCLSNAHLPLWIWCRSVSCCELYKIHFEIRFEQPKCLDWDT